MALKIKDWEALSTQDKNTIIDFLKNNCKIDREHPKESQATPNSYPIADGITSGGHKMKYGEEYRIYVKKLQGIPVFLDAELKDRGTKNRIGGSAVIKAIMAYGQFKVGNN